MFGLLIVSRIDRCVDKWWEGDDELFSIGLCATQGMVPIVCVLSRTHPDLLDWCVWMWMHVHVLVLYAKYCNLFCYIIIS